MKRIITVTIASLVMASCATSAGAVVNAASASVILQPQSPSKFYSLTLFPDNEETFLEQEHRRALQEKLRREAYDEFLKQQKEQLTEAVLDTKQYVGKTWYVFSGSTPRGWDCSGLVMWTYSNLGIELEHSATAQMKSGEMVSEPKLGDIVSFSYHGSKKAYHVGIYIGPDTMLHSGGKKGDQTELQSISAFAGDYSTVQYTRLIKTN